MSSSTASRSSSSIIAAEYLRELESEARATRQCLEQVSLDDPKWKPHDRSMELGYLATLIADMPRWIRHIIESGTINFGTWEQKNPRTTDELITLFNENMEGVKKALQSMEDRDLSKTFRLKSGEEVLISEPVGESISQTINHMVHHRGQLTVYLRLMEKKVPSIYGPSADTGAF